MDGDINIIDGIYLQLTNKNIDPVIASETSIFKKINEYYEVKSHVEDINIDDTKDYNWKDELHNDDLSQDYIKSLFRAILKQAIAQDIHELYFENTSDGLSVNFKKPDKIIQTGIIPSLLSNPFIQTLKQLANLDPNVSEIHHPPMKMEEMNISKEKIEIIKQALNKPGVMLFCGASLSGKTHLIYSVLSNLIPKNKNVMTLESVAKYRLKNVSQCELNENIGFNLDKAMRFIEFQSPDIIYFEGITTKEGLDFFTSLTFKNKALLTEFLAENMDDLRRKFEYSEFNLFKSVISCLVFIHNKKSIEVFDKNELDKYLF